MEENSPVAADGANENAKSETAAETEIKAAAGKSEAGFGNGEKDKYELTLEAMLKAGMHFGHKKSRWNPKMGKYIFGIRNGVHIIDLERSLLCFERALEFIGEIIKKNGVVLLVGTKKQAKDVVGAIAQKANLPYVNERWLGGTFTNFDIIKKRLRYLAETKEALEKGKLAHLTKLERHKLNKKIEKIDEKMGGLVGMNRLPDVMIALDVNKEGAAIKEAKKAGIKIVGLIDSNSDPDVVDYPIPANDDALSSLKYILGVFLKRIMEAKNEASVDNGGVVAKAKDVSRK